MRVSTTVPPQRALRLAWRLITYFGLKSVLRQSLSQLGTPKQSSGGPITGTARRIHPPRHPSLMFLITGKKVNVLERDRSAQYSFASFRAFYVVKIFFLRLKLLKSIDYTISLHLFRFEICFWNSVPLVIAYANKWGGTSTIHGLDFSLDKSTFNELVV